MPCLPDQLRASGAAYLHAHPNHLDSIGIRVLLDEPISEEEVVTAVERILSAIDPPHSDADEAPWLTAAFGGTHAQQLINYNRMLPASLHRRIVDSLIGAVTSGRGELLEQADAIRAVWNLSEALIRDRADEIIAALLQVEPGRLRRTGISFGLGSVEDVRRASLQALGRLHRFAWHDRQEQIQLWSQA